MTQASSMYFTIQKMSDIPYQQAQINLYNNRIWCSMTYHFFSNIDGFFPLLGNAVDELALKFGQVI